MNLHTLQCNTEWDEIIVLINLWSNLFCEFVHMYWNQLVKFQLFFYLIIILLLFCYVQSQCSCLVLSSLSFCAQMVFYLKNLTYYHHADFIRCYVMLKLDCDFCFTKHNLFVLKDRLVHCDLAVDASGLLYPWNF